MADAAKLTVVVDANIGGLNRGLTAAEARTRAAQKSMAGLDSATMAMGRSSKRGGAGLMSMASSAKVLGGAAGVGGVAMMMQKVVKTTANFSKQMAATKAVSGATAKQMAKLREQAMTVGPAFGYGATQAAQAQTELAKGGLKTSAILSGGFKSAVALAAAGELDMADAATFTVNAMKTFGIEGRRSAMVADAFAMAANKTTADVGDFGMAMTQGGSAAKAAGYSFRQTMTVLGALAEIGVKNSDAGTSMKTAFLQLLSPTKKQAEAAKKAGLSFRDQNGELKKAVDISRMLRDRTEGMTKAQRTALFSTLAGTDGLRTLLALYQAGPSKLQSMEKAWQKQGYAVEVAKQKQEGLHGDLARLSAEWESAQIELGNAFAPGLTKALQSFTTQVKEMRQSGDLTQIGTDMGTALTSVAKAAPAAAKGLSLFAQAYSAAVSNSKPLTDLTDGFDGFEDGARKITKAIEALRKIPGTPISDPFSGLGSKAQQEVNKIQHLKGLGVEVPVMITGKDDVIKGMRNIDAIRLKNKIQRVLGQNTDAQSKVNAIRKLSLPKKLQRILGQNSDALSKIAQVQSYVNGLQDRTVSITVKASLQGSMAAVSAAMGRKVGGEARGGGGRSRTSLVGEGRRGEYLYDSTTGQTGWVDSPTLMDLGPQHWVIPTDPAYRGRAASLAQRAGIQGFAGGKGGKDKKVSGLNPNNNKREMHTPAEWKRIRELYRQKQNAKKRRPRVEQVDPTTRPSVIVGDKLLNPLLPAQNLLDQVDVPSPPQYSAGDVALSQARASGNLGSVQAAAAQVVAEKTAAYNQAVASGDGDKIKEAADALTVAASDLKDAGAAITQSQLDAYDAQLVRAKIMTPKDLTDDLAALQGSLGVATKAYNDAYAAGDVAGQIQYGNEMLNLTASIDDLKKSVDNSEERLKQQNDLLKEQLDEAHRLASTSAATSSAIIKGLTDAANRQLGGVLGAALSTPSSAGQVAVLR